MGCGTYTGTAGGKGLSHQEKVKQRFTLGLSLLIPYPPPGWGVPPRFSDLRDFEAIFNGLRTKKPAAGGKF